MSVIFLSKLQQRGSVHPGYYDGEAIYSLISDQSFIIDDVSTIVELHELKSELMSILQKLPGFQVAVLCQDPDADYIYSGSVWENKESFTYAMGLLKEIYSELILKHNTTRNLFFQKFNIEYSIIGLFLIDSPESASFVNIESIINTPPIILDIVNPFSTNQ